MAIAGYSASSSRNAPTKFSELKLSMIIRTFEPGDEESQARIYNEGAGRLPGFKPATHEELRRRTSATDFDPSTRLFGIVNNQVVGYASGDSKTGRISYPWCRQGYEDRGQILFEGILQAMNQRGIPKVWSTYRADWLPIIDFFERNEFRQSRKVMNWILDPNRLPNQWPSYWIAPLQEDELPAIAGRFQNGFRLTSLEHLKAYFFNNSYFKPESAFVVRQQAGGIPLAIGLTITNPAYADARKIDSAMPCFRLGAFGSEGYAVKRIHGLFSVLCKEPTGSTLPAVAALGYALKRFQGLLPLENVAAQSMSDHSELSGFYDQYFQKQGSFPILERSLLLV